MKTVVLRTVLALPLLLVAAQAQAIPNKGSLELRLGQTFIPPLEIKNGFTRIEPDQGPGLSSIGIGAGLGYFATDYVEVGLSASYVLLSGQGADLSGPGVTPFLRFLGTSGRLGYFAEINGGFQSLSQGKASQSYLSVGADLGIEVFITADWAIRLAPGFHHLIVNSNNGGGVVGVSSSSSANQFGITWGIAAYF
jgi:hypothetical protein